MSRFTKWRLRARLEKDRVSANGEVFSEHMKHISEHPAEYIKSLWKGVYKLPLHVDSYGGFVWTKDGEMALSSFGGDLCDVEKIWHIVDIINGKVESDYEPRWSCSKDDTAVHYNGEYKFLVRGWGHLTGCGGLNLPAETAALIQDGFMEYVVDRLNGKAMAKYETL